MIRRTMPEERIPYWPYWKRKLFYKIENLSRLKLSRKMILAVQGLLLFGILPIISKRNIAFDFSGNYILWSIW